MGKTQWHAKRKGWMKKVHGRKYVGGRSRGRIKFAGEIPREEGP
jgi:hypothetical protein